MSDSSELYRELENILHAYRELTDNLIGRPYNNEETLKTTLKTIEAESNNFNLEYQKIKKYENYRQMNFPLQIGIVGSFKSGKSTVINSIIGEDLLGVGVLPATSRVTILKYGQKQKFVRVDKSSEKQEISKKQFLEMSVHNHGAKKKQKNIISHIDHFEIDYPLPLLQNFHIIDTPGFSSKFTQDDDLTNKWLDDHEVDVLLWVFDVNKGTIDNDELELLETYKNRMLLAILNKMDDKPPSKRKKLIESFAAQFSFDWFIPYAAKPISEFRIALNDKILKLEKIIDSVRPRLEHGQTVTISCEKSKIFVVEPGNPACLFEKALDHAEETEFYDYYKSLMDYVGGLQKEVNQLKDRKLKSESKHLIKSQNEILNQICGSINEDKEAIINDFTELDKQKDVFLNSLLRKVNKLHDNCNNLITEKIHQLMFKGYTKGKLFKTEYIRIKMGNKWRVRSVLQEHYSKFVKDLDQEIAAWIINTPLRKFHLICFDEFENYLSARGNQLKFNLGFITENLIQTAFSSLGTFFDNWQQVAIENNRDEIDVKIQKSIQSCLSTGALKKIALNFYRIKVWRLFHAYQKDQDLLTKKLDICLKLIRFKLRTKCNWKN